MKTIIAIAMAIAMVSATSYTLATGSSYTFTLDITANSANSSLQDLAITLDAPDVTATNGVNDAVNAVGCVNVAVSNYTLAADTTNLAGFIAEWTCATACNTNAGLTNAFVYSASSAVSYTHTGTVFATAAAMTDDPVAQTATTNATAFTHTETVTGATPANALAMSLPNMSQTFYYRCWAQINVATGIATGAAIANWATVLPTANGNVTVKGSSYGVAAVLAVAGSLAASFAF